MLEILYVEDNPADVFLISSAISKIDAELVLTCVSDGEAAIEFLRKCQDKPCLILLDLGLPRIDGAEVFRAVKANLNLRDVPVIVFAERDGRRRVEKTGHLPELFLSKPMDLDGYADIARQITELCRATPSVA